MLSGRVAAGLLNALIFRVGNYSLPIWLTGSFVTALPGIIIQLILIPVVVMALRKAGRIPED
jgi:niacin transporter